MNSELVDSTQKRDLLVLGNHRPALMSILTARLVQITDAQLNLATGICVESADGHIMTGNKILLEDVVLA
ncbi:hypothetical protein D3C81_2172530 [compost metagenome]